MVRREEDFTTLTPFMANTGEFLVVKIVLWEKSSVDVVE